jgi:hypothetical protein
MTYQAKLEAKANEKVFYKLSNQGKNTVKNTTIHQMNGLLNDPSLGAGKDSPMNKKR